MKLKSITTASRNRYVSHALLRRLSAFGLRLQPYYVYVEGQGDASADSPLSSIPDGYELVVLGEDDMEEVSHIGELRRSDSELRQRIREGQMCVALKHTGRVVSLSWVNPHVFDFDGLTFELKPNEAYMYGAETIPEFRGRGLAPVLRRACYNVLRESGRTRFYSYSLMLNTPAIRFKEKLGAQIWLTCLYIEIGGRFARNWILKSTGARPRRIKT